VLLEFADEAINLRGWTFDPHDDALPCVDDMAAELQSVGEAGDGRAQTNPLHPAGVNHLNSRNRVRHSPKETPRMLILSSFGAACRPPCLVPNCPPQRAKTDVWDRKLAGVWRSLAKYTDFRDFFGQSDLKFHVQ